MPARLVAVRDVLVGGPGRRLTAGEARGWFAGQVARLRGRAAEDLVLEVACREAGGALVVDDAVQGATVLALREQDPDALVRCFLPD